MVPELVVQEPALLPESALALARVALVVPVQLPLLQEQAALALQVLAALRVLPADCLVHHNPQSR